MDGGEMEVCVGVEVLTANNRLGAICYILVVLTVNARLALEIRYWTGYVSEVIKQLGDRYTSTADLIA